MCVCVCVCVCVHNGKMMYSTFNTDRTQEYFVGNSIKHVDKGGRFLGG